MPFFNHPEGRMLKAHSEPRGTTSAESSLPLACVGRDFAAHITPGFRHLSRATLHLAASFPALRLVSRSHTAWRAKSAARFVTLGAKN